MYIYKIIAVTSIVLVTVSCGNTNESENKQSKTEISNGVTISTFKVWGNCNMCKETIESSLKVEGISKADWNKESKMISVSYDVNKISLEEIQKHIASVGYDNEKFKGDDKAYKELPECCQYDRK